MPNRIIKESCRTSPTLDALSAEAERMHWRLTTAVDDYGRFDANPKVVLSSCFPLKVDKIKPAQVEKWLLEMTRTVPGDETPLITLYEVKGRRYGTYNTFLDHQRKRDSKPKFPGPDDGVPIVPCAESTPVAATRGKSPQDAALSESVSERRETNPRDERRTLPVLAALEEFKLADMTDWLKAEGIDLNAGSIAFVEFKDYWRSCGGKRTGGKEIKDWPATFRNRIRELKKESRIKLAVVVRPKPELVVEPKRTDPPTAQAVQILDRLLPGVAGQLKEQGA